MSNDQTIKCQSKTKPELLLPVGSREMALAAIHNGADAIYIGFPGFNARGRSVDFALDELLSTIQLCHLYGVKVNLALNILTFENELEVIRERLEKVLPLKPDALIIQDLGLVQLVREMAPDQAIHASTQMTVTNHEAIRLLEDLNIRRFVLGRENSLSEIEIIRANTDRELEVFVHGALCVAYSGQCFTSESIGGRSANRGQCAQSCRFGYDLYVDGKKYESLKPSKKYLVSPQDLCGLQDVSELMRIGVNSFKVEGRLKTPEYVASVAHEYRKEIDRILDDRQLSSSQFDESMRESKERMSLTYSRGFFSGWLHGVDHQKLVGAETSSHQGVRVGKIDKILRNRMRALVSIEHEFKSGDGLLWIQHRDGQNVRSGGQIYSARLLNAAARDVKSESGTMSEELKLWEFDFGPLELPVNLAGADLFWNHDPDVKRELQKSYQDKAQLKKIPVSVEVEINLDAPLIARISDGRFTIEKSTASSVQLAQKSPTSDESLFSEMSALGGTVFSLSEDDFKVKRKDATSLFVNNRELKELRRSLSEELAVMRESHKVSSNILSSESVMAEDMNAIAAGDFARQANVVDSASLLSQTPRLTVLLRMKEQVQDLCTALENSEISRDGLDVVILDFEFSRDYPEALALLKSAGLRTGVATTRILKPKEYTHLKVLGQWRPDVILVRNLGAIQYITEDLRSQYPDYKPELRGDFSLNVTNHKTAQYLLSKGLNTVCASYDLNHQQMSEFLEAMQSRNSAGAVEVTMHQYMPSFHMEHCVFAAFLSNGSSYRDCGRPCEKHRVELKDEFGRFHFIKPDPECRNTMFNAISQSASRYYSNWSALGLKRIRYEALFERGEELVSKIGGYQDLIAQRKTSEQLVAELSLHEKYGLDERSLSRTHEYQARKKN